MITTELTFELHNVTEALAELERARPICRSKLKTSDGSMAIETELNEGDTATPPAVRGVSENARKMEGVNFSSR